MSILRSHRRGGDGLSRMRKQKAKAPPSPFSSHCCDREGRCSGSQKHGNFRSQKRGRQRARPAERGDPLLERESRRRRPSGVVGRRRMLPCRSPSLRGDYAALGPSTAVRGRVSLAARAKGRERVASCRKTYLVLLFDERNELKKKEWDLLSRSPGSKIVFFSSTLCFPSQLDFPFVPPRRRSLFGFCLSLARAASHCSVSPRLAPPLAPALEKQSSPSLGTLFEKQERKQSPSSPAA